MLRKRATRLGACSTAHLLLEYLIQPESSSRVSQDADKVGRFRCMRCHWEDGVRQMVLIDLCTGRWDLSLISATPVENEALKMLALFFSSPLSCHFWGTVVSNCRLTNEPTMILNPTLGLPGVLTTCSAWMSLNNELSTRIVHRSHGWQYESFKVVICVKWWLYQVY